MPLLADRDLTARGVEVDFFGERTRAAVGPAALGVATAVPIVPTSIYYERLHGPRRRAAGSRWGIVIHFHPRVTAEGVARADQVGHLTQAWVSVLEREIAERPEDWHMLQKIFVADLDPQRYAATLAKEAELQ